MEKKERERLKSTQGTEGVHKRKRDCDGSLVNDNGVYLQKEIEPDAEQLERSNLTEEYGQPIVSESLCYSSDGKTNGSKTKITRIEQPPPNGSCTAQGKVIRFSLNQREPENAPSIDDQPSTSGRTEVLDAKQFDPPPPKYTEDAVQRRNEQFVLNATSVKEDFRILLKSSSPSKKVSRSKSAYEALFSEWVPHLIQFDAMDVSDDDETWLLLSKKDTSILKACEGLSERQSISQWPRAHLLPKMDLYALPYRVIF